MKHHSEIFLSPKTKDEMYREDLFPRHFIQYINPLIIILDHQEYF